MKTSVSSSHPAVRALLECVRERYGLLLNAPKDYEPLSEDILRQTRQHVNGDTLRRLYGYRADSYGSIRRSTLDILALYVGFTDWEAYIEHLRIAGGTESAMTHPTETLRAEDVVIGQEVEVAWQPDRVCRVMYIGQMLWEVICVENSHTLQAGDRFYCSIFATGETAFLDKLTRNGQLLGGVRIGIDNGITYVKRMVSL